MAPVPKTVQRVGKTCRSSDQRGFTLIDMLFVIALVGLLSVLALPGILRARGAAQASSALGTMRAINSGQLSYAITCGLNVKANGKTNAGSVYFHVSIMVGNGRAPVIAAAAKGDSAVGGLTSDSTA